MLLPPLQPGYPGGIFDPFNFAKVRAALALHGCSAVQTARLPVSTPICCPLARLHLLSNASPIAALPNAALSIRLLDG